MLFFYIIGGIAFFVFLWAWAEYCFLFNLDGTKRKWAARGTLFLPFWPLFFSAIFVVGFFKFIKKIIKACEF